VDSQVPRGTRQVGLFIGRRTELRRLRELAGVHQLITLTGLNGVGKTRLAAEFVRGHADRVAWADLGAAATLDEVITTIARALGIEESRHQAPLDAITRSLAPRAAMVVLDNCERVITACAEVAPVLVSASASTRVLCTSTLPLGVPGEVVFPLLPLAVPGDGADAADSEAVQLFLARAPIGPEASSASTDAIATICRRLDGLPLAIELAAARARMMTPAEIAARLDGPLSFLADASEARPVRHRTLEATIAWAVEPLSADAQLLLRRLAVFPASFSLDAAEAIAGFAPLSRATVLDLAAGLVDRSLVSPSLDADGTRYRILDSVRAYLRSRAGWSDEELVLKRRLATWTRDMVLVLSRQLATYDDLQAAVVLGREAPTIDAALAWSVSEGDTVVSELVAALSAFWHHVGWLQSHERFFKPALERAAEPHLRCDVLIACGRLAHYHFDDVDLAETYFAEAAGIARSLADGPRLATVLSDQAVVAWHRADVQGAAVLLRESRLYLDGALPGATATVLSWSDILLAAGDDPGAVRGSLEEAVAISRERRLVTCEIRALSHLGELLRVLADYTAAEAVCRRVLELQDTTTAVDGRRLRGGRVFSAANYANVLVRLGRPQEAVPWAMEGLESLSASGSAHHTAGALLASAGVLLALGYLHEGTRVLGAAESQASAWWEPADRPDADRYRVQAGDGLGPEAASAVMAEGASLHPSAARSFAHAALSAIPAMAAPAAPAPNPLSVREKETLALLAHGLTNREIADRLVLSVRTVESHVSSICAKLGVRSRVQAAALATEYARMGEPAAAIP
jgi:non-specific serine/threonine protein kinase